MKTNSEGEEKETLSIGGSFVLFLFLCSESLKKLQRKAATVLHKSQTDKRPPAPETLETQAHAGKITLLPT